MYVFSSLFSIFCLLFGGYFAKKIKILKQKQARAFLDFAIIFALPCLIFERTYHLNFDFSLIVIILIGLFSALFSALFCTFLGFFFKFSKNTLVSIFLLSSFGNTLFVGIPIISGIYKEAYFLGEIILYDALATSLPVALLAPFVISLASEQKVSFLQILKKVFTFPPFVALILGICFKPITLPEFVFEPLRLLGSSATPIALFAIGLNLGFSSITTSYKATSIVIFGKMILTPLIFLALLKLLNFDLNPSSIIALLESAMPTMTMMAAMIMKAKLDTNLAVSSVAFGIVFAFISLPIWVYFLT
ncbi:membrane protein [Campylobacter lari]|uniref:Putative membrane protein, predicted permease n=1 Tax=Campylobacter lari NCTC 11845 TaxID=1388749 RepID=A0A0A8HW33_CAMLA|nr:AEC family transporter [Campylobacter lari]AJD02032.1 putative membrane protein, predicted permease [Campylobacter lari NCTC 11845]EAK0847765.1 AEC family transporter [Campylobacter lari]EAK0979500.1 AEC family transporter [Campylobacter lari]EAK9954909.1 AEC family transporter [Campylobacter lari]MCR6543865.1 AEC family transporter [Campylobacter lari]